MLSSPLSWIFTVVFLLTGVYSLLRLAEMYTGPDRSGSRLVELSHLLMSIAMIAMSWAWGGDASTPSGVVQIVVFGLFAVWFLIRLVRPEAGHSRLGGGYHLVMNAAMVWMVAAMPQIMGMSVAGGGGASHDHGGMAGMGDMTGAGGTDGAAPSTPVWAGVVSGMFVVLLVAAAVLWTVRLVRRRPADPEATSAPVTASAVPVAGGSVALVAPVTTRARATGPLCDVGCHLLMSVGMAAMLLVML